MASTLVRFSAVWCFAGIAAVAQPASEGIMLFKAAFYDQYAAGQCTLRQAGFASIVIVVDPTVSSVSVLRPGGVDVLERYDQTFLGESDFGSLALLDASYPDGTYTVRIVGGRAGSHDVAVPVAGPMSAPLLVSNYAAAQAIPNGTPFTLAWPAVPGATDADLFQLTVTSNTSSYSYETPGVGEPGAIPGTATSFVVSLPPNESFVADLMFVKLSAGDARIVNASNLTFAGVMTQTSFALRTVVPPVPPKIVFQPNSAHVTRGMPAQIGTLATIADGDAPHYQWYRDGQPIPGATDALYYIASAQSSDMGFYWATIRGDRAPEIKTDIGVLTVSTPGAEPARLINLSARAAMPSGSEVFAGFSLRGNADKNVLLRGVGPQLWSFGLPGVADPQIRLYRFGESVPIYSNDDWGGGAALRAEFQRTGAFPLTGDAKSAALSLCLPCAGSQSYSMRVANGAAGSGATIAEIYDSAPDNRDSRLFNLSARAIVSSGDNVMVCGFVIGGSEPAHVLVRAVGPSLRAFGIADPIADPRFAIVPLGQSYTVAANDDWIATTPLTDAFNLVGAFGLPRGSKDAALEVWLPPRAYTVTVAGPENETGSAIVEIYDLAP